MRVCLPSWATRLRGTNDSSRERGGRERTGQEVLWKALEGSETWPGLGGRTDTLQLCSEHGPLRGLWSVLCMDQTHCACPGEPRFRETGSWFPRQHRKRQLPEGVLRSCAAFRASSKVQRVEHPLRQAVVSGMEPEVDGVPGKRAGLCPWCWSGRGPGREDGCSLGPSWEER